MVKDHMKKGTARGGGVPSSAVGVHSMVGDDRNDAVVVQIFLSKDEILGLFTKKKPHFQLEVGMLMEDSSVEKHKARPTSYTKASGSGWSWMGDMSLGWQEGRGSRRGLQESNATSVQGMSLIHI